MCYNPVPCVLSTCPSVQYFCSHAPFVNLGTPYHPLAVHVFRPPTLNKSDHMHENMWWAIVTRMMKVHLYINCIIRDKKQCLKIPPHTEVLQNQM